MNRNTSNNVNEHGEEIAAIQTYLINEIMENLPITKEREPELRANVSSIPECSAEQQANTWDLSDDHYFKALDSKQLASLEERCPDVITIENKSIHCTACNQRLYAKLNDIVRHPLLGVAFCKNCKCFYGDGMGWEQDEDGSDKYCRWCGRGGEVIVCDNCLKGFCVKCLQRNLGRSKLAEIKQNDQWACVDCNYQDIQTQKCEYYGIYKYNQKLRESVNKSSGTQARKKQTFIDKVFEDSFQAINKYQKLLEEQQKSLLLLKEPLNSESAAQYSKVLRKLHQNFRRKTHMIDKSIVKSFSSVYPDDASKVYTARELSNQNKTKQMSKTVKSKISKKIDECKKVFKIKVKKRMIERTKKDLPNTETPVSLDKNNSTEESDLIKTENASHISTRSKRKRKNSADKNDTKKGAKMKRKDAKMKRKDVKMLFKVKSPKKLKENGKSQILSDKEKIVFQNNSASDSEIDIEN